MVRAQACLWRLIPRMEQNPHTSWIDEYGFSRDDTNMVNLMETYTESLYWSVMTFTTIGKPLTLRSARAVHSTISQR